VSATAPTSKTAPRSSPAASPKLTRITSIDALRGFVMFTMIYVNDIAGAGRIVPDWMVHFSDRHSSGSGMTFVDLVFPAFLFIVGMSIPFALGSRVKKGESLWKTLLHILIRTLSLLFVGVLMVNEAPSSEKMGWPSALWQTLLYLSAILAFCEFSPGGKPASRSRLRQLFSVGIRVCGLASLSFLAIAFIGRDGHRIITLSPFSIHTEWWGILGIIGWAYLVGALAYLTFGNHRTALLGCTVLLLCLYPAEIAGVFSGLWLADHVSLGATVGAHGAIVLAGVLLASMLAASETPGVLARVRFALLFISGFAVAAWLTNGLYGIHKNNATPSWCLWACTITAALWLLFYLSADVGPLGWVAKPLAVAGENVLLAYLLSCLLPSALPLLGMAEWYHRLAGPDLVHAVARAAGCAVVILCMTAGLNRLGFRLKL